MPEGGALRLGTAVVVSGNVELSIQDTGSGVPAADRECMFCRFHDNNGNRGEGIGMT
jgi:signal transduction histidine kinase